MDNSIKKKIILAPGANGNELYKSLALRGIHTADVSVMNGASLAQEALINSGIFLSKKILTRRDQENVISDCIKGVSYFDNASISDIARIVSVINTLRKLVDSEDEEIAVKDALNQGVFKEKNTAICEVYLKYRAYLSNNNCLDSASLMREALFNASSFDAEFIRLEEFPLTALEEALLNHVSDNNVVSSNLLELFNTSNCPIKVNEISNCYGASNEIEHVLESIFEKGNIDNAVIAVADSSTYGQLLYDYSQIFSIPMSFGCGLSVKNSSAGRLLNDYYQWCGNSFYGKTSLNSMVFSNSFDRSKLIDAIKEVAPSFESFQLEESINVVGKLRLTNNKETNEERLKKFIEASSDLDAELSDIEPDNKLSKKEYIEIVKRISKELSLSMQEFINKYSRKGNALDASAKKYLSSELYAIEKRNVSHAEKMDLIANALASSIPGSESNPGTIFVTDIHGALTSFRKNLYVVGLTANKFPGSPKENYMLLDTDLACFGKHGESLNSFNKIKQKREEFFKLLTIASSLGIEINLSFAGLNVSELKTENASSVLFDICDQEKKGISLKEVKENRIKRIEYFEPKISRNRLFGEAYLTDKNVKLSVANVQQTNKTDWTTLSEREYSPTGIVSFFECPRKFYYASLLRLPEVSTENDFEVIPATDYGIIAHFLMQKLANVDASYTLDDFKELSRKMFDDYCEINKAVILEDVNVVKNEFLLMMENAYPDNVGKNVPMAEDAIHYTHPKTGIKLMGYPDRLEEINEKPGFYRVVDYKTGKKVKHKENDVDSCFQTVLYCYLVDKDPKYTGKILESQYRYLRHSEMITCPYNAAVEKKLDEKLENFKNALVNSEFPMCADEENCKYCAYKKLCGRN